MRRLNSWILRASADVHEQAVIGLLISGFRLGVHPWAHRYRNWFWTARSIQKPSTGLPSCSPLLTHAVSNVSAPAWWYTRGMSTPRLVSDELWAIVAPLLPPAPPRPKGGRPRLSDRAALTGILFVLRSGKGWELLPPQLGCGSGMTCWRRLRAWQRVGVWEPLRDELLLHLADADTLDWSRATRDEASVAANWRAKRRVRRRGTAAPWVRSASWWSTEAASRFR